MRVPFVLSAIILALVACGGSLDPNAPILINFTYNENQQPSGTDQPYDSVRVSARTIAVARAAVGNLCGSRLTAGVVSSGAEVTLRVNQTPVASCTAQAGLITYLANLQLVPGSYHLLVVERNSVNPQGAVVIDKAVVVPAVD